MAEEKDTPQPNEVVAPTPAEVKRGPSDRPVPQQANAFTFDQLRYMAAMIVESRLFPDIKSQPDAFALVMLCHADGLHPMNAVREFHFFAGKPTLKAEAVLARFQRRGGQVKWVKSDDKGATARFYTPGVKQYVEISWGAANAQRAGLLNKDNYKHHPEAMYRARCVTAGVRAADPGAILGYQSKEEAEEVYEQHRPPDQPPTLAGDRPTTSLPKPREKPKPKVVEPESKPPDTGTEPLNSTTEHPATATDTNEVVEPESDKPEDTEPQEEPVLFPENGEEEEL